MRGHFWVLSVLAACAGQDSGNDEFVGQTIGDYSPTVAGLSVDVPTDQYGPGAGTGGETWSTCGGPNDEPALALEVRGADVDVTHTAAMYGACCVQWSIGATVDDARGEIAVAYTAGGTATCDCACSHTLAYTLLDVPPGTWTVVAAGLSAQVTVP